MKEKEKSPETAKTASNESSGKNSELNNIIESVLFASTEILSMNRLKQLLGENCGSAKEIREAVAEINRNFQIQRHPLEIVEIAGGFRMRTIQKYSHWVREVAREKASRRLSQGALETLAIIANKQPCTKAEVEAIRGVQTDGALKTLLERNIISIVGRSDKPGKPIVYGTTKEFLEYFGLNRLSDMPKVEDLETIFSEKSDEEKNSDELPPTHEPEPENSSQEGHEEKTGDD
ncbi:MAG: SMC-Scp complex subunit ScpB [Fibrobacterota bacterium]